jgi:hypothetical protein
MLINSTRVLKRTNFSVISSLKINTFQINSLTRFTFKRFSKINEVVIERNPNNEEELILRIPSDSKNLYSFSNYNNSLILYSCSSKDFTLSSKFIPLHKTTIVLCSLITAGLLHTTFFQPSLFATLFLVHKFLLQNQRKRAQIVEMSLNSDLSSINIKVFQNAFNIDIGQTKIIKRFKVFGVTHYLIKNPLVSYPLYLKENGRCLNYDFIRALFDGRTSQVKIKYE